MKGALMDSARRATGGFSGLWVGLLIVLLSQGPTSTVRAQAVQETPGPAHFNASDSYERGVSRILQRLCIAVEKAYEDVGVSKEDVQRLLALQAPPQKLTGKWKAYQETWPMIVEARGAAIAEMASLGAGAVPVLLQATDQSEERRGGDIFILAIAKIGKPAVPAAIDGLSHEDPVARTRAAASLGRIGDRRAVEPLIRALGDRERRVSNTVVWSLGLLADARAVAPLLRLWNKPGAMAKSELARALGQIGDKRPVEPITAELQECLSQAQREENWDTNGWAMRVYASALGQIGDPQAVPVLKKALLAGPQRTKARRPHYLVAEAAAEALRALGVQAVGDTEKGGYRIVETSTGEDSERFPARPDNAPTTSQTQKKPREGRDYKTAQRVPQPIAFWKVEKYGCGGSPRTAKALRTDIKRRYPVTLIWPLIQGAGKYVVHARGVRGSRPPVSYETATNFLRLEQAEIAPGRYQWCVSAYDAGGTFLGEVETIDPVEIFAIEDPEPVARNGKRVVIDLNHSAGHVRGWGYYNHAQYMTKALLEEAGFEVHVNERDLLTAAKLRGVDLLICHYYWTGWPGFRPYLESEVSAVRRFVEEGGSLLVVGCDRTDGGGNMSQAGNELVQEFGLSFALDGISEPHGWAEVLPDQTVINLDRRIQVQLPVAVRGDDAQGLLQFKGAPIARAKQFGDGRIIVAGVGMSLLDCYLGDFEHREGRHRVMFYDFVKYLTGVDGRQNARQTSLQEVLPRTRLAKTPPF